MAIKGTVPNETAYTNQKAGESLAAYSVVCLDGTTIKLANPSNPDRMPAIGIIKNAVNKGKKVNIYQGVITNDVWNLVSGQSLFLMSGGVPGHNIPASSGNIVQLLGKALTKTTIHFQPEDTIMV